MRHEKAMMKMSSCGGGENLDHLTFVMAFARVELKQAGKNGLSHVGIANCELFVIVDQIGDVREAGN